jgi:hypothetical protein
MKANRAGFFWRVEQTTLEESEQFVTLRSLEWLRWPLFVSQPVVPVMFFFLEWWKVVIGVVVVMWLWALIRNSFVSVKLADVGCLFVKLRWFASIAVGLILLVFKHEIVAGLVAALWPIAVLLLTIITPPGNLGLIAQRFREQLELQ